MINVTVAGRVTRDAETRAVGGSTVCKFAVVSNKKIKGEERATFVDCDLWGKRGDALVNHIHKGDQITVSGELETREYEGKTYLSIRVNDLELQGGSRGGSRDTRPVAAPAQTRGYDDAEYSENDSDDIPF